MLAIELREQQFAERHKPGAGIREPRRERQQFARGWRRFDGIRPSPP